LDFSFYDVVWFWKDAHQDITDKKRQFGRWLGVSSDVGTELCYWILTESGKVVSRTSVQHVTVEDMLKPEVKQRYEEFETTLLERLKDDTFHIHHEEYTFTDDEYLGRNAWPRAELMTPPNEQYGNQWGDQLPHDEELTDHADDPEVYDEFINAQIVLHNEGEPKHGRVIKRACGSDGRPIGRRHPGDTWSPELGSREYVVQFDDGTVDWYTENIIARNIFSKVDRDGTDLTVLRDIVDHRKNHRALSKQDGRITTRSGATCHKITTIGWQLLVEFADGTQEWVDLHILKDSNPVELDEYAVANRISDEPAFAWWVPQTLRKRNRIVDKVKKRYWRISHKFGIRVPKSVEEALEIDRETNTDYWYKAIKKEMDKVLVAFEVVDGCRPEDVRANQCSQLRGHQEIKCHMVFDVKMDLTRKARYVAGGHTTDTPTTVTYSSVVSRDSVHIAFLLAGLNGLKVSACDIGNAYLNAKTREKIWTTAGIEFPPEWRGKPLRIVGKEDTETNLADFLTKVLGKARKDKLVAYVLRPHSVRTLERDE
jgi:hypothetical protein